MAESRFMRMVYDASPSLVQDLMSSAFGLQKHVYRYNHPKREFWENFYRDQLVLSEEELREYQWSEFLKTVRAAYDTVPFYRGRFNELGITPADIKCPADVTKIPYTTKDDIRSNSERIISESADMSRLNKDPTSGSTGRPLLLYNGREAIVRNYAVRWAQCRPGLSRSMRNANFTGLEIVQPSRSKPPFWRANPVANQRLYSVFHMNDEALPYYFDNLNDFAPEWIYGYPSAIYTLASFMERTNRRLSKPLRAVVTSSEQCLDIYRNVIERVFETTLWDEYGQAELAALAFQCECGKLHENISYSFLEFVPTGEEEDGFPVCELICTSTINPEWPLLRYQVGDTALIDPDARCPAGHPGRIIERMYGRTSQFLETRDGRRISNISVMAKNCRNIKSCQAVQEIPGEMVLRIVRDNAFTASDANHAIAEFRKKLGGEDKMRIRVEYADEPLLTGRGKFMMIVSKL